MNTRQDFLLRLIEEKDLATVLQWRNSDRVRANMFTDHTISMDEHRAWFYRIRESSNEKCCITEYRGCPFGVVNISAVDRRNNKCNWGFYLKEAASGGSGAVMGYLALEHIFEIMEIRKLCGEVFAFNLSSIKFHRKLGFVQEGYLARHILKINQYESIILMSLFRENWMIVKDELYRKCFDREESK